MPIVIKPGVIPVPTPPWWETVTFECHHCHCQFKLSPGEMPGLSPETFTWARRADTTCPTCGVLVTATEPGKPVIRHSPKYPGWYDAALVSAPGTTKSGNPRYE